MTSPTGVLGGALSAGEHGTGEKLCKLQEPNTGDQQEANAGNEGYKARGNKAHLETTFD